jgi:lipopolysaccharide transport system ATP-binding protein
MGNVIISVENLGKCYRINHQQSGPNDGLRHVLNHWATAPLRALRAGRQKSEVSAHPPSGSEDFWALRDVSFEIKQGEVLGIIGRNGAGKSTLLKILSRITEPSKGRVRIKGRVASLLEVGTGFHPELTGRENVFLNGAILGMSRAEIKKKFDEIIAFAEVEKFLDTPVKRYSSGMYVRLAFAVAAHLEPEILIVDEVLAVGDAQFQKKCLGKMQDVSKGGRTVLFVSHNMDAVQRLCVRALLLKDGGILVDGEIRRAIVEYSARHAAQLPMIDLLPMARPWQTRLKAKFTTIKMISTMDNAAWHKGYGEKIGFEIGLKTDCPLSGLELGISVFTASGTEITSNLSGHVLQLKSAEAGPHVFKAMYPELRLIPGSYYVQLGLRSAGGDEDFILKACEFEVTTSELSAKERTDSFRGVLVPEINCEFK